ncbi:MAG: hypothetical protein IAG13_28965 [Deltaproteobacteria bacterium]|nr:hypothetical protein [Nannocystaceae bacterium]
MRAFVELAPDDSTALPRLRDADDEPMPLVGPAAAARHDRARFGEWLGIYALCQLWIGAFVVWLGTRSLAIAISAALTSAVTLGATTWGLALLGLSIGPAMLPGWLLAGAAGMVAAGRSCRAVDLQRPMFATGMIVTSLCQIAAGIALLVSPVPMWRELGAVVVLGSAAAAILGMTIAPGLCELLRRIGARKSATEAA